MSTGDLFGDALDTGSAPVETMALPSMPSDHLPLAERLRPSNLGEVIGQQHLLGAGMPLRVAFESGKPHSMILWGPPGVGKTTLARLLAKTSDVEFVALSAVLAGVKDIRDTVAKATETLRHTGKPTLVFVDEVHRFSKSQQDAFLPHVESGLFIFIGATTENPSFEVNSALLSRARVYVLKALESADLLALWPRAQGHLSVTFSEDALQQLAGWADGDARRFLNTLQSVSDALNPAATAESSTHVTPELLESVLGQSLRQFDKGGDAFYDQISALHKSVRGSDPDASLYWMCRMLDGGATGEYVARRLVRMASEDIGLADPRALQITLDAAAAYERLGSPEGELALAQAVVYLAVAPKSNAVYKAYKAARQLIAETGSAPVPAHLRNAPTSLMKTLGHGAGYRYAHDEPGAYAAGVAYYPDNLNNVAALKGQKQGNRPGQRGPSLYQPTDRGLELKIRDKLAHLRELDAEFIQQNNPS